MVGRLGQGVLALVSWRTFADYATMSMETTPMTYSTFLALFLETGPSFMSNYRLARDLTLYRRLRSRVWSVWIVLCILFVLAWPTLTASMSGYTPVIRAYVEDVNTNFVRFSEFQPLSYIIHDGSRIGLTDKYYVAEPFGKIVIQILGIAVLF